MATNQGVVGSIPASRATFFSPIDGPDACVCGPFFCAGGTRIASWSGMKDNQHQSLGSGAPSQSGDLGDTATAREKEEAAIASDRVDEAAPQPADAGGDVGNPTRSDRSLDHGMASPGAAAQADASARHAAENPPRQDREPKRQP